MERKGRPYFDLTQDDDEEQDNKRPAPRRPVPIMLPPERVVALPPRLVLSRSSPRIVHAPAVPARQRQHVPLVSPPVRPRLRSPPPPARPVAFSPRIPVSPVSPVYSPSSPAYSPSSPHYSPSGASPARRRREVKEPGTRPVQPPSPRLPISPSYSPSSPAYAPGSPAYSPAPRQRREVKEREVKEYNQEEEEDAMYEYLRLGTIR